MDVIKSVLSLAVALSAETEKDRRDTNLSAEEVKVRTLDRLIKYHSLIGRLIKSSVSNKQ